MKAFGVLDYISHVRAVSQLINDGVMEMMHEAAFIHWAAKGKNVPPRGMDPDQAKAEFVRRRGLDDAIIDEDGPFNGPAADFRARVAVHVKSNVTDRNLLEKAQGPFAYPTHIMQHLSYPSTCKHTSCSTSLCAPPPLTK